MKQNKLNKSKFYEHFSPIEDTPENVAKILLTTPQKKKEDWRYLKKSDKKILSNLKKNILVRIVYKSQMKSRFGFSWDSHKLKLLRKLPLTIMNCVRNSIILHVSIVVIRMKRIVIPMKWIPLP